MNYTMSPVAGPLKSHVGFNCVVRSSFVVTVPFGIRLTRYAPWRIAFCWTVEMPLRLLRMLPASLLVSVVLMRGGGAKSRAVKVPDLRSMCLFVEISMMLRRYREITHGLGITERSS